MIRFSEYIGEFTRGQIRLKLRVPLGSGILIQPSRECAKLGWTELLDFLFKFCQTHDTRWLSLLS